MGVQSQSGHVGVRTQASKGVFADPGAVAPNQGVFYRIKGGAMGGNRELLIPDSEIGGNRDIPDAQLGPIAYSGEYDLYWRMEMLPTLLKGALGSAGSAGALATGYTHTILPTDAIPWLSVEEEIGAGFMVFKYTDCAVNTLHLEADANGYLQGSAGLIGLTQATTTATAVGLRREDTSPLIVGSNITVSWGGVTLPAKSFSMDINNNIEDDDFRLGSLFLGDLTAKRREVTAGVTIRPQDSALWKTAMWGGPAATVPLGLSFKDQVVVTITSYEDIPGSTGPAVKYSAVFTFPKAIIKPFSLDPQGDDVLEHDMEIQMVRPVAGTPIVTPVIKNSYATVA